MTRPVKLVCSVCGSDRWSGAQRSMDERWMLARCPDHRDKHNPLTPLISERAFIARKHRRLDAQPEDVFGGLSDEEKARLTEPIKLTNLSTGRSR